MAKTFIACRLVAAVALALLTLPAFSADVPDNLISNGGFEAGMQIWRGDGKIVLLPDGNRVCEIEASKSRMKDLKQEFHLRQLQQVEVLFRARSVNYTGPGIRISIHQIGGGSLIWNRDLPQDGSWKEFHIVYTRTPSSNDLRELNIATLFGTGQIQIDDVEVREPSKVAQNEPPEPVAPPAATPVPPSKPFPPVASIKPPAPPLPFAPPVRPAPVPPSEQPPLPSLPAGTFGSLDQIMHSVPPETRQKLQTSDTLQGGITEANAYFTQNVKGKPAQFQVKVDVAELSPPEHTRFRIRALDHPVMTWNGGEVNGRLWTYFAEGNAPSEGKATRGADVTISGVIGRCDISVNNQGHLQLSLDLQQSKLP